MNKIHVINIRAPNIFFVKNIEIKINTQSVAKKLKKKIVNQFSTFISDRNKTAYKYLQYRINPFGIGVTLK